MHDKASLAREQICGIAMCGHRPVKIGSVNAIVRELRKKLAAHDIRLDTLHGFGWKLQQKDRARIVALIGFGGALGGAKSQQESRMESESSKIAQRPPEWLQGHLRDQAEDDAERIDRIAAAKLEEQPKAFERGRS